MTTWGFEEEEVRRRERRGRLADLAEGRSGEKRRPGRFDHEIREEGAEGGTRKEQERKRRPEEAPLCYRLQMDTITRTVAGKKVGEGTGVVAGNRGDGGSQEGGHVGGVVKEVCGTLCAIRMDG